MANFLRQHSSLRAPQFTSPARMRPVSCTIYLLMMMMIEAIGGALVNRRQLNL